MSPQWVIEITANFVGVGRLFLFANKCKDGDANVDNANDHHAELKQLAECHLTSPPFEKSPGSKKHFAPGNLCRIAGGLTAYRYGSATYILPDSARFYKLFGFWRKKAVPLHNPHIVKSPDGL